MESSLIGVGAKIVLMELMAFGVGGEEEDGVSVIAVTKTSKTMLNSSGESEHPCLVPDFRGNAFNFSPLRIMFAVKI